METSIFTPDLGKLAQLDTLGATRLIRGLLWCEAARLGLKNIVVSEDTSTADGGIDAKADLPIDQKSGAKGDNWSKA
jgi:hypothetical protein